MNMTPLFHRGGSHSGGTCPTFFVGAALVVMRSFSPRTTLQYVEKYGVTFLTGSPASLEMLTRIQEKTPYDLSRLKGLVTMGAPLEKAACKKFMEERIINQYLNLEKISRKEVNFKSKLIEWSQKNKFNIEFNLTGQSVDEAQNPIFETQVLVENIAAGTGKGYSKKESQQEAAHETLAKIKGNPQFIDAIFAAKAKREKEIEVRERESAIATAEKENVMLAEDNTLKTEIPEEHFEDTERIIAEAEEAAFRQNNE